jgi:hypothetical protein
LKPWRSFGTSRADFCILFGCVATKDSGCDSDIADNEDEVMSSDPVPSAAIYDATTGGRSVIIVTGGSTGDVLTLQADGTYAAVTPAGGSLSGTGAVNNAVLRADGTGGATLQNSAFIIADNATASPNNTVNHASIQATGGTTNVSLSIVPKGTGAFCLAVPDSATAGGNARGANAVDLQTTRSAATQVASGANSFVAGIGNTASGTNSFVVGKNNVASGDEGSIAIGQLCTAAGYTQIAIGYGCTANSAYSNGTIAMGFGTSASCGPEQSAAIALGSYNSATNNATFAIGTYATATRYGMFARAAGRFAALGDAQFVQLVMRIKTTDATATTLMLDGATTRLTITSGKIMFADILISGIKSDGSAAACYKRKVAIKNVGGTTSLVGTVETMGTDIEDNASTDIAITADDTNDALQINVTGIAAETWRWVAVVEGLEIAYGS